MSKLVLIDGDIIAMRSAFTAEDEEEWIACSRADALLDTILLETGADGYEVWLTGRGNFRYKVFPEYKANRFTAKRPKWEQQVKQHLVENWQANWSDGCEADDMLGVRAHVLSEQNTPVVCSIDKDLDQIVGHHYNFVKKESYVISNEEARYFFYYQLLIGDTADGIKGAAGIGPKKAARILEGCSTDEEYLRACLPYFSCWEELELNAKCLWIWKHEGDIWDMKEIELD